MSSDITRLSQEPDGESVNSSVSQCVVSCNTIICYFGNGNNKENNDSNNSITILSHACSKEFKYYGNKAKQVFVARYQATNTQL